MLLLLSWSHLWLIFPLQSLRTSHQVPKISVIPIITHSPSPPSEILTLVTYTHPMPPVYKCQINSSVNPVLFKSSVLMQTSHLGIQILLNLALLFLTNLNLPIPAPANIVLLPVFYGSCCSPDLHLTMSSFKTGSNPSLSFPEHSNLVLAPPL